MLEGFAGFDTSKVQVVNDLFVNFTAREYLRQRLLAKTSGSDIVPLFSSSSRRQMSRRITRPT